MLVHVSARAGEDADRVVRVADDPYAADGDRSTRDRGRDCQRRLRHSCGRARRQRTALDCGRRLRDRRHHPTADQRPDDLRNIHSRSGSQRRQPQCRDRPVDGRLRVARHPVRSLSQPSCRDRRNRSAGRAAVGPSCQHPARAAQPPSRQKSDSREKTNQAAPPAERASADERCRARSDGDSDARARRSRTPVGGPELGRPRLPAWLPKRRCSCSGWTSPDGTTTLFPSASARA